MEINKIQPKEISHSHEDTLLDHYDRSNNEISYCTNYLCSAGGKVACIVENVLHVVVGKSSISVLSSLNA